MADNGAHQKLFAVTTRSRLRGPWYFPHMMIASLRIRRQLARTGDVVRWASIVAGPTEFWTITVWKSRHDMQEFMRSGAHDDIMWLFSKWLRSFWLMRWRPGPSEIGRWKGVALAQPEPAYPSMEARPEALERALDFLPKLRTSMDSQGGVTYESTPSARRSRAEVRGAGGAIVHLTGPAWRSVEAVLALRSLKDEAEGDRDHLRSVVGVSRPGQAYLLSVWQDRAGARRLLGSPQVRDLVERWPGCWANEWIPENEFGHWDGLRLRRTRSRVSIPMPQAARELGTPAATT